MSRAEVIRRQTWTCVARGLLMAALATVSSPAAGQSVPTVEERAALDAATIAAAAGEQLAVGPAATLAYANRSIVQLRSSLLGRSAAERVAAGRLTLDRLVDDGVTGPIQTRDIGAAVLLEVAGRRIVAIVPSDVDILAGETPAAVAAAQRLDVALNEAVELWRPRQLLTGALQALLATVIFAGLVIVLGKGRRSVRRRIDDAADRRLHAAKIGKAEFVRSARIIEYIHRSADALLWALGLVLAYLWLTFVLRRFPYTRPWGETLRSLFLAQISAMAEATLQALPGLVTVLLILLITRVVVRLAQLLFQAVEGGRISIPGMYPETAQPTRKLVTIGLWLFAVAISYPYLPGSNSDAFRGMSVFVGLVVSLGSSGIMNQIMSGFTLTYSRALRVGDFVAVGDVEGTVTQVGTLSTKITTVTGDDVTIPNALVVSQTVTNYSRLADTGVFVPAEVTIGYDAPWRQVEALLLLAAARSAGVRREPAPRVRQAALESAYVRYSLQFCLEDPAQRRDTLAIVHANILDAFNEYGVQMTSPNYEADPDRPKIVPRDRWFAAPAAPPVSAHPAALGALEIKT